MEGDFISVETRHGKPCGQHEMAREETRQTEERPQREESRQVRGPQAWNERGSLAKGRNQQVSEPCKHSHICHL